MEVTPFALGWLFFAGGVAAWVSGTRDRTGLPIVGKVVDHKRKPRRGGYSGRAPDDFYPIIEYTCPTTGTQERLTSPGSFMKPFEIGAEVELRYNQARNEVRFPTRSTRVIALVFMGWGLMMVAFSLERAWNTLR